MYMLSSRQKHRSVTTSYTIQSHYVDCHVPIYMNGTVAQAVVETAAKLLEASLNVNPRRLHFGQDLFSSSSSVLM